MIGQGFLEKITGRGGGIPKTGIEETLHAQTVISTKMLNAIKLWTDMYIDQPYWKGEDGLKTKTQNLPAAIAREFARLITQESEISVGGDARGQYINEQLQKFLRYFTSKIELYCAKGGIAIKPYISGGDVVLSCYTADRFFPTAYDTNGDISGAVFIEQIRKGDYVYTRLEWHTMTYNSQPTGADAEAGDTPGNQNLYTVTNRAFRSEKVTAYSGDDEFDMLNCRAPLQDEVPLDTLDEWSDIEPEITLAGLESPLFVYIKVPSANNVDTYCPLGVSVYSLAVDTIKEADRQYTRCINEYRLKEAAVHASVDLWTTDKSGRAVLPEGMERLYRSLDDASGELMEVYSPDIRDTSFFAGLEKKKREIELLVGLAYGTLSEVQETAKTATEIRMSKQRSFTTVRNMQNEIESGLERVCYVVDALADIYNLAPAGNYELACQWGDNVLEDTDKEYTRRLQLVMSGMLKQETFMAWYFGCTEADAIDKYMPVRSDLYAGQEEEEEIGEDDGTEGGA